MSQLKLLFVLVIGTLAAVPLSQALQCKLDNPAVKRFREYLRIDTSQSAQGAIKFWERQAEAFGLEFSVFEPAGEPVCVLTWPGADPALPSIMLNSHMDVVPALADEWSHPPFGAEVDEAGDIFGRGSQDTKDVAIQYLEAIGRLKSENVTLQRSVHITLMPDEETGGFNGMKPFLKTADFANLNVGFALDEGMTSETDDFYATYQDRRPWFVKFTVEGDGGHGFIIPKDAAIIKLNKLINILLEYRKPLAEAVESKKGIEYGPYTTLNINMINGSSLPNVIPQKFTLVADLRLSPKENATEVMSMINSWVAEVGNKTKVEFIRQEMISLATPVDDSNPYWVAMKDTIEGLGYNLHPIVCPATSDLLPFRNLGLPGIGFATKRRTTPRLHGSDEYLNVDTFLEGIDIYYALIRKLGNLPPN